MNALISLLADSYARVQENAVANRRKEKAEVSWCARMMSFLSLFRHVSSDYQFHYNPSQLIVEYMSLLPTWRRRQIEQDTQYFHALLQADADGDLIVDDDDWQGGLAALREDIEESNEAHALAQQKALESLKSEFANDLESMRKEMVTILRDLSEDVKQLKNAQKDGLFSGQRAARAVKGIRQASASLLLTGASKKEDEETK